MGFMITCEIASHLNDAVCRSAICGHAIFAYEIHVESRSDVIS